MLGMNALPRASKKSKFSDFRFVSAWGCFPGQIHFEANLKVDREVDIRKGEVPTVSRGRSTGIHVLGSILYRYLQDFTADLLDFAADLLDFASDLLPLPTDLTSLPTY